MLADRVAMALGVKTQAVNQAVKRRAELFTDQHCFVLTQEEFDGLVSQSVIPKPGRGGNRFLPRAFTQKGVIRLATTLRSPTAVAATDLVIDLFLEVYTQIAGGKTEVLISNPTRLRPDPGLRDQLASLRGRLIQALNGLLDTVIDPQSRTTVRDEMGEIAGGALSMLKAHLQTRQLENDKLAADTLLILIAAPPVPVRHKP